MNTAIVSGNAFLKDCGRQRIIAGFHLETPTSTHRSGRAEQQARKGAVADDDGAVALEIGAESKAADDFDPVPSSSASVAPLSMPRKRRARRSTSTVFVSFNSSGRR